MITFIKKKEVRPCIFSLFFPKNILSLSISQYICGTKIINYGNIREWTKVSKYAVQSHTQENLYTDTYRVEDEDCPR